MSKIGISPNDQQKSPAEDAKLKSLIHPEIEKFYLTAYEAVGKFEEWNVLVGLKGSRYHTIGAYTENSVTYYLDGKRWTEGEMLKIIRLKAFL